MTRGSSTSCLSTLIRASLPRSLLRLRRHSVDGSSLPAAFAVRLASNAAFCPSTPRVCCATHLYASPTLMYTYCTPSFRGGTTPGPQARPNTCAPLAYLSLWLLTLQVRTGDSWGCTRRGLARSVRSHRERFNGTILELASLRLGFRLSSRAFRTMCARPFSPPPFALTAAQPSPPAPLHMCRVQPKHPCIACRTHPARAVLVPRPEHARTHAPPCCPHVAGAHVTGPDWRPPGFYETMLGCISTCSLRAFQRSHSRVRQPPSRLSGFESGVQNQVRPPVLTATLYPDRGTAEPSCTPLRVPRAAQAPVHRMPHPLSPGGPSSPPRARAYPSAALSPSRGRCIRFRSGLATLGVRGDLLWRDLYVRVSVVSTVPCTSSVAAVCRRELLSAVVFSLVAGAWLMVARVCYSSVYF